MLTLILLNPDDKPTRFELDGSSPELIGRHAPRVKVGDSRASRRHAEIAFENGMWTIRDLGSSNGTHVNGERIAAMCQLEEGDQIRVGRQQMVVGHITEPVQQTVVDQPSDDDAAVGVTADEDGVFDIPDLGGSAAELDVPLLDEDDEEDDLLDLSSEQPAAASADSPKVEAASEDGSNLADAVDLAADDRAPKLADKPKADPNAILDEDSAFDFELSDDEPVDASGEIVFEGDDAEEPAGHASAEENADDELILEPSASQADEQPSADRDEPKAAQVQLAAESQDEEDIYSDSLAPISVVDLDAIELAEDESAEPAVDPPAERVALSRAAAEDAVAADGSDAVLGEDNAEEADADQIDLSEDAAVDRPEFPDFGLSESQIVIAEVDDDFTAPPSLEDPLHTAAAAMDGHDSVHDLDASADQDAPAAEDEVDEEAPELVGLSLDEPEPDNSAAISDESPGKVDPLDVEDIEAWLNEDDDPAAEAPEAPDAPEASVAEAKSDESEDDEELILHLDEDDSADAVSEGNDFDLDLSDLDEPVAAALDEGNDAAEPVALDEADEGLKLDPVDVAEDADRNEQAVSDSDPGDPGNPLEFVRMTEELPEPRDLSGFDDEPTPGSNHAKKAGRGEKRKRKGWFFKAAIVLLVFGGGGLGLWFGMNAGTDDIAGRSFADRRDLSHRDQPKDSDATEQGQTETGGAENAESADSDSSTPPATTSNNNTSSTSATPPEVEPRGTGLAYTPPFSDGPSLGDPAVRNTPSDQPDSESNVPDSSSDATTTQAASPENGVNLTDDPVEALLAEALPDSENSVTAKSGSQSDIETKASNNSAVRDTDSDSATDAATTNAAQTTESDPSPQLAMLEPAKPETTIKTSRPSVTETVDTADDSTQNPASQAAADRVVAAQALNDPAPIELPAAAVGESRRVVYLVDASGTMVDSMSSGVNRWLTNALEQLEPDDSFAIVFFRSGETFEPPPGGMNPASMTRIDRVLQWIDPSAGHVRPSGKSDPLEAFQTASSYQPTEVYILSDNRFGQRGPTIADIGVRDLTAVLPTQDTVVHTVQFYYRGSDQQLRAIADRYDGTYQFVEEKVFGRESDLTGNASM